MFFRLIASYRSIDFRVPKLGSLLLLNLVNSANLIWSLYEYAPYNVALKMSDANKA